SPDDRPAVVNDTPAADGSDDELEEVEEEGDEAEPGLLDAIILQSGAAHDESTRERTRDLIHELVNTILSTEGTHRPGATITRRISERVIEIDRLIDRQLGPILHYPDFQRLHATWLGLHELVRRAGPGPGAEVSVLHLTKKE